MAADPAPTRIPVEIGSKALHRAKMRPKIKISKRIFDAVFRPLSWAAVIGVTFMTCLI